MPRSSGHRAVRGGTRGGQDSRRCGEEIKNLSLWTWRLLPVSKSGRKRSEHTGRRAGPERRRSGAWRPRASPLPAMPPSPAPRVRPGLGRVQRGRPHPSTSGSCRGWHAPEPWKVVGGQGEVMRWGLGPGPWAERACWLGWAVRDGQPWALGPGSMAQLLGSLTSRSWAWLGPLCSSEAPGGTALLSAKERVWLGPWAVNDRGIVLQSRRDAETPWLTVGSGCGVPSEGASRASSQSTLPPPRQWPSRCQFMGEGAEARRA